MEEDHIVHIVHTVYPAFSHVVADITLISLGFIIVNDVYYFISPDCISHLLVRLIWNILHGHDTTVQGSLPVKLLKDIAHYAAAQRTLC